MKGKSPKFSKISKTYIYIWRVIKIIYEGTSLYHGTVRYWAMVNLGELPYGYFFQIRTFFQSWRKNWSLEKSLRHEIRKNHLNSFLNMQNHSNLIKKNNTPVSLVPCSFQISFSRSWKNVLVLSSIGTEVNAAYRNSCALILPSWFVSIKRVPWKQSYWITCTTPSQSH